jgi:serine/threonine-protein kinase
MVAGGAMNPSVDYIWDALARSRLLSPQNIGDLRQRWHNRPFSGRRGEDEDAPAHLLRWLVTEQCVTEYQAELLAEGRPARFFLGPYKLLDRAGTGRGTVVYRAMHGLGAVVALKTLAPTAAKDRRLRTRFRQEASLAVRLKHPNVVRALHAEEDDGLPYLIMEYLEGQTVQKLLATRRLGLEEAVDLVIQALLGLHYLFEQGATPRTLGPADLMVVPAPGGTGPLVVKILGSRFGLAESSGDVRAGIYGLGCVLYHALAGQPPFPETGDARTAVHQAVKSPRPVQEMNATVPAGLQQILNWMMAEDPTQRYQTPLRAVQALRLFLMSRNEGKDLTQDTGPPLPSDASFAPLAATCWEEILKEDIEVPAPPGPPDASASDNKVRSWTRRDALVLVLGAAGLLGAQVAGWLLARSLRR